MTSPSPTTCGNGVVDPGEACDTAIAAGAKGACPTRCASDDACTAPSLAGEACQARCTAKPITAYVGGDGCCPAGATHATDPDCAAAYGEACVASKDCATGMCNKAPHCEATGCTCTKTCTFGGLLSECGGGGRFCAKPYVQGPTCTFVVDTGNDGDDKPIGLGVPVVGNVANAKDVDVFVFDAALAGSYVLSVTAIDPSPLLDVAFDVYGDDAALQFTVNDKGAGATESTSMTIPAAGRVFFAVRSANTNGGNYRVTATRNN